MRLHEHHCPNCNMFYPPICTATVPRSVPILPASPFYPNLLSLFLKALDVLNVLKTLVFLHLISSICCPAKEGCHARVASLKCA